MEEEKIIWIAFKAPKNLPVFSEKSLLKDFLYFL